MLDPVERRDCVKPLLPFRRGLDVEVDLPLRRLLGEPAMARSATIALRVPDLRSVRTSSSRPERTSCGLAEATRTVDGRPRISMAMLRFAPLVRLPRPPFSRKVGPAGPPPTVWASIITTVGFAVRP